MNKRKKLFINISLAFVLVLLLVASALVYFNYYPRVTIYFIDEYNILNAVELKKGNPLPNLPKPTKTGSSFEGWYTDEDLEHLYTNDSAVNDDLNLFAKFEKIKYTLHFRMPGTQIDLYDSVDEIYYNDEISLPTGQELIEFNGNFITLATYRPGFNFAGWTLNEDGTGQIYTSATGFAMVPYDAILYPKWTPKVFTYTFRNITYGGPNQTGGATLTDYCRTQYQYTGKVIAPEDPVIEHYTFVAWYYDMQCTEPVVFDKVEIGVNGQLIQDGVLKTDTFVLYGKFDINMYDILFDVNTPTGYTVLVDPSNYLDPVPVYFNYLVPTLPDGSGLKAVQSSNHAREVYKFMGWNTSADGTGYDLSGTFRYDRDEDMTLYAQWERYYDITFLYKGGVLDHYTTKMIVGDTITLPIALKQANMIDDITEAGKHFAGWTLSSDGKGEAMGYTYSLTEAKNVAFYAKMDNNTYHMNIMLDGGIVNAGYDVNNISAQYTSTVPLPDYTKSISKTGYQMNGWIVLGKNGMPDKTLGLEFDGSGTPFRLSTTNIKYAELRNGKWTIDIMPNFIEEITVTYNLNGATGATIESDTKLKGGYFTIKGVGSVQYLHYTFAGWSASSTATEPEYLVRETKAFEHDITLYAVWTPVTYSLKIVDKGVTGNSNNNSKTLTFDILNPLQLVINAEDLNVTVGTGYTFEGLTSNINDVNKVVEYEAGVNAHTITVDDVPMGSTTLTLYTVITRNVYTVTWSVDDTQIQTGQISHGDKITHPADPTKEGSTFRYWMWEDVVISKDFVVSSDMDLVAVFEKNTFTLTFKYFDPEGTEITTLNKDYDFSYGDQFTQEQYDELTGVLPEYFGYDFIGFYNTQNPTASSVALNVGDVVTGRVVYYTCFEAKEAVLTFTANGGVGSDYVVTTKYNETITLPTELETGFTNSNYSLYGWLDAEDNEIGKVGDSYTVVGCGNITYKALWKERFTVTYEVDADTTAVNLPSPTEYVYGTVITIPTTIQITKVGVTFSNYWTDQDGNTYVAGRDQITVNKDITLTPSFGVMTVEATYMMQNPSDATEYISLGKQTYNYGDDVEFLVLTTTQLAQIKTKAPNYEPDGWCLPSDVNTKLDSYTIKQSTTFLLRLSRFYKLNYNLNAEDAVASIPNTNTFVPGKATTITSVTPTRRGYSFLGWSRTTNGSADYAAGEEVTFTDDQDITLYAIYEEGGIELTFVSTESSQTSEVQSVRFNSTFVLPSAEDKEFAYAGHRLVGWYEMQGATKVEVGKVGESLTIDFAEPKTLYAVWAKEYSVVFTDGTNTQSYANKVIVGEEIQLPLNNFTVVGKSFANWSIAGNEYAEAELVTITEAMVSGSTITFTAVFEDIYYNVTWVRANSDAEVFPTTDSVIYGGTITAPTSTDTENYKFLGWGTADGAGVTLEAGGETPQIYANTTYYAQWGRLYSVTYTDGITTKSAGKFLEGTEFGEGKQEFDSTFTSANATLVGYQASTDGKRYQLSNDYNYTSLNNYQTTFTLTGNVTFTAVFAQHRTLTLTYNGTVVTVTTDAIYGNIISLTEYLDEFSHAESSSYIISGYSLSSSGTQSPVEINYQMPDSDTTLYPIWTPQPVAVTFVPNNGQDTFVVNVTAGQYAPSQTVTYENYRFLGWYNGATLFDFDTTVINDPITLTAKWQKQYIVSFDYNIPDGETTTGFLPIVNATYELNDVINLKTTIDRTGYSFVSWNYYYGTTLKSYGLSGANDSADLTIGTDLYVNDADNVHQMVFQATWTAKAFDLTINPVENTKIKKASDGKTWTIATTGASLTLDTVQVYCDQQIIVESNRLTVVDINGKTIYYTIEPTGNLLAGGWGTKEGETITSISTFNMPSNLYNVYPILNKGSMTITYTVTDTESGTIKIGTTHYVTYTETIYTGDTSQLVEFVANEGFDLVGWYVRVGGGTEQLRGSSNTFQISGEIQNVTVRVATKRQTKTAQIVFQAPTGFVITTERFSYGINTETMDYTNQATGTSISLTYGDLLCFRVTSSQKLIPYYYTVTGSDTQISVDTTNSVTVKANIVITVVFDVKQAVVTYYDGAVAIGAQNVKFGTAIGDFTYPSLSDIVVDSPYSGKRFVKWYTDQAFTTELLTTTIVNDDMSVYAKRIDLHKLVFNKPADIITTGSLPTNSNPYAVSAGTFTFVNDGNLAREGYTLTAWKVTYGAKSVNVSLTETRTVAEIFGTLTAPTLFVAEPVWTIEQYTIKLVTNSTASQTKCLIIDKTNLPVTEPATVTVTYGDVIRLTDVTSGDISVWELAIYHVTNGTVDATPYVTYRAQANDVSWIFRNTEVYIGAGLTSANLPAVNLDKVLDNTDYAIGDLSDKAMFVKFNFKGNQLVQKYTVKADYAGSSNYAVQVIFEIKNTDANESDATVEVGANTYTNGTHTHSFKNGDTFEITVPRDNANNYVKITMTACEGFYLVNNGSNVETYNVNYSNIVTHSNNTITAKLDVVTVKLGNITTGWGSKIWGSVVYSYTLKAVDAQGFITQEDGTSYNNNASPITTTAVTLQVPYFTNITMSATANPGRRFVQWQGTSTINANTYTITANGNCVYNATYEEFSYTYTFKIDGVEFGKITGLHTEDDVTSQIESYTTPTPSQIDAAPYNLTNKWFTEWALDGLYDNGKIIVGTENITINATLVDAYEVTVSVTDGGSYTMTASGLNYAYERSANADGSRRFKVQTGKNLPTITASAANDGYKYIGFANASLNEPATSNTGYTYTRSVTKAMSIVVTYELKKYTIQFMLSDATSIWTGHVHTNQIYTSKILELAGGEWPTHLQQTEQYVYTLNYWKTKVGGNYVQLSDTDTIYSVLGNLEDGTTIQVVPEYTRTEKYQLIVKNGSETVYSDWHFTGDQVELSTYTQSGKQFVYLSTSSTDNGRKTISDIGNTIYNVQYVYATETVGGGSVSYRQNYTGADKATKFTVGTASVTLHATYVNMYSVTMKYDNGSADTVRNNIVADTIVGLTQFETTANTALQPHHNVLVFKNDSGWSATSQIYSLGETASDASTYFTGADKDKYINPDGQIIVGANTTFTYVRRQISITVKIYTDATQVTSGVVDRQGLIVSGATIKDATYTYGAKTEHVLPYYTDSVGQWSYAGVSAMTGAPWTSYQGGYTFVGYWVYKNNAPYKFYNRNGVGTYTLNNQTYNNNKIADLTVSSDVISSDGTIKILCVWNLDNVAITIGGDLPSYTNASGTTTYTTVTLTYTTMVGNADCIATAQTVTTSIDCNSTNKIVNVGYATEATMSLSVSEDRQSNMVITCNTSHYLSGCAPQSKHYAPYSTTFKPTANDTITFTVNKSVIKLYLTCLIDGSWATQPTVTWKYDGSTSANPRDQKYGDTLSYDGTKFTLAGKELIATLSNTTNFRIKHYRLGNAPTDDPAFDKLSSGDNKILESNPLYLTCIIERIYTINFDDGLSAYTATNMPSTQVVGAYDNITTLVALDKLPTITGYTFKGWKINADNTLVSATTTTYKLNKHYNDHASLTFTAQWEANIQTITMQLKVLNADATADITSTSTDIFFDNTSFTMRFDSTLQYTSSTRNFSIYSGNGASMTTHATLKNNVSGSTAVGASAKYEYVSCKIGTSNAANPNTIKGDVTYIITVRVSKYTITLNNNGSTKTASFAYGTTLTMPSRATGVSAVAAVYRFVSRGTVLHYDYTNPNKVNSAFTSAEWRGPDLEGIFSGYYNSASGGTQVTSHTVTGAATLYAQWGSSFKASISFNKSNELTDSSSMTVDGVEYDQLLTISYRVPMGTSGATINTTIEFSSKHPWLKTKDGSYYYIQSFVDTNILTKDSNGNITYANTNKTSFSLTITTGGDYSATWLEFLPGDLALNFNNNSNNRVAYEMPQQIDFQTLETSMMGVIKGRNISTALNREVGTTDADRTSWYASNSTYDDYYKVYGFSTDANTVTNINMVSSVGFIYDILIINEATFTYFKSLLAAEIEENGSCGYIEYDLYAVWQTRDNSEAITTVTSGKITAVATTNSSYTTPFYSSVANGGKLITGFNLGTSTNRDNILTVYLSPWVSTITADSDQHGLWDISHELQKVYVHPNNKSYVDLCGILITYNYSTIVCIPDGVYEWCLDDYRDGDIVLGVTEYDGGGDVDLSATTVSKITTIGSWAMAYNDGTRYLDFNIRNSTTKQYYSYLTRINDYGLRYLGSSSPSLEYVYCGNIQYIGDFALYNQAGMSYFGGYENYNASGYSYNKPSITYIGDYAFRGCNSFVSTHYATSRVNMYLDLTRFTGTSIGYYTFAYCYGILNIKWPTAKKLTEIKEGAFYDTYLIDIKIPEGVTTIYQDAFIYGDQDQVCMEVSLPSTLTDIRKGAFACYDMHVVMHGTMPDVADYEEDYVFMVGYRECILEVYYDYYDGYEYDAYDYGLISDDFSIIYISAPKEWFNYTEYGGTVYIWGIDYQDQSLNEITESNRFYRTLIIPHFDFKPIHIISFAGWHYTKHLEEDYYNGTVLDCWYYYDERYGEHWNTLILPRNVKGVGYSEYKSGYQYPMSGFGRQDYFDDWTTFGSLYSIDYIIQQPAGPVATNPTIYRYAFGDYNASNNAVAFKGISVNLPCFNRINTDGLGYTFAYNTNLQSVTFANDVRFNAEGDSDYTFYNCTSLTDLPIIPYTSSSVTSYNLDRAYAYNCTSVTRTIQYNYSSSTAPTTRNHVFAGSSYIALGQDCLYGVTIPVILSGLSGTSHLSQYCFNGVSKVAIMVFMAGTSQQVSDSSFNRALFYNSGYYLYLGFTAHMGASNTSPILNSTMLGSTTPGRIITHKDFFEELQDKAYSISQSLKYKCYFNSKSQTNTNTDWTEYFYTTAECRSSHSHSGWTWGYVLDGGTYYDCACDYETTALGYPDDSPANGLYAAISTGKKMHGWISKNSLYTQCPCCTQAVTQRIYSEFIIIDPGAGIK